MQIWFSICCVSRNKKWHVIHCHPHDFIHCCSISEQSVNYRQSVYSQSAGSQLVIQSIAVSQSAVCMQSITGSLQSVSVSHSMCQSASQSVNQSVNSLSITHAIISCQSHSVSASQLANQSLSSQPVSVSGRQSVSSQCVSQFIGRQWAISQLGRQWAVHHTSSHKLSVTQCVSQPGN